MENNLATATALLLTIIPALTLGILWLIGRIIEELNQNGT